MLFVISCMNKKKLGVINWCNRVGLEWVVIYDLKYCSVALRVRSWAMAWTVSCVLRMHKNASSSCMHKLLTFFCRMNHQLKGQELGKDAGAHTRTHTHRYIYNIWVHAHSHTNTCAHTHTQIYIYISVCSHTQSHKHMHACTHTQRYIWVHTHTVTQTHTHIRTSAHTLRVTQTFHRWTSNLRQTIMVETGDWTLHPASSKRFESDCLKSRQVFFLIFM